MNNKKLYNLLLILFPVIYLVHNFEEYYFFKENAAIILKKIPIFLLNFAGSDQSTITSVFSVAILIATILPLLIVIILWNKSDIKNVKILGLIAFITLVNGISHISSSFIIGGISPGLFTGVILCIPYAVFVNHYIRRNYQFTWSNYFLIGFLGVGLFIFGLALIWAVSFAIIS